MMGFAVSKINNIYYLIFIPAATWLLHNKLGEKTLLEHKKFGSNAR